MQKLSVITVIRYNHEYSHFHLSPKVQHYLVRYKRNFVIAKNVFEEFNCMKTYNLKKNNKCKHEDKTFFLNVHYRGFNITWIVFLPSVFTYPKPGVSNSNLCAGRTFVFKDKKSFQQATVLKNSPNFTAQIPYYRVRGKFPPLFAEA
jgi:hypothetical protein